MYISNCVLLCNTVLCFYIVFNSHQWPFAVILNKIKDQLDHTVSMAPSDLLVITIDNHWSMIR